MKKIKLNEVRKLTKKDNQEEFESTYYFSYRFSNFFTYFFINASITPNQITGIFFLVGLLSCFLFFSQEYLSIVGAFLLWRLHIILDLCDGEVARYSKQFSFNGAYWDYMIHSVLYPLCFIAISISLFNTFYNHNFLILAAAGSLAISVQHAIKNTYFRALYSNKKYEELSTTLYKGNALKKTILELISFDYFLFIYLCFRILELNEFSFSILLTTYVMFFIIFSIAKFISFSRKNK